jgi:hypothetical protein
MGLADGAGEVFAAGIFKISKSSTSMPSSP